MSRVYPLSSEMSTWHDLFSLYSRCPSVTPDWFHALRSGSEAPTGLPPVDASLVAAWSSFGK